MQRQESSLAPSALDLALPEESAADRRACPACGGRLIEIRAKSQCSVCHRICETCCEGGRG